MLVALLENNNNTRLLPGFRINPRSSAGRSRHSNIDGSPGGGDQRGQGYDLSDIVAAAASFPEIAGEDPAIRAIRRLRWVSEALPFIKEAREKREAAAFLIGAQMADAAAEERHAAQDQLRAAQDQLKIEQIVEIIDEVRAEAQPTPVKAPQPDRGKYPGGGTGMLGPALIFGGIGLVIGIALARRPQGGARRPRARSRAYGKTA